MSTKVIKYISVCLLVLAFGVFGTGVTQAAVTVGTTSVTSDGALTLTGATASNWTTSAGALTITAAAASTWSAGAGDLTIDSVAGSLVLDSGEATADAVRIIASATAGGIDVDAGTAGIDLATTATILDAFDIDANSLTTADVLDINATSITEGDFLDITVPATRTSGTAILITDASATGVATAPLIDVNVNSTATTNVLDITYATGVGPTGSAIDLNMGTNVAGDAINIASASTTGDSIDITQTVARTSGSAIRIVDSADVTASAATVQLTASTITDVDAITVTTATQTTGNAMTINAGASAYTTGTALEVTGSGIYATDADAGLLAVNATGIATDGYIASILANVATTVDAVLQVSGNALTSGNGLVVAGTGTGLTGNLFSVTSASTGAATNGLARFNFSGAHTGNGLQIDDATLTGAVQQITASGILTGAGAALSITADAATTAGATAGQGIVRISADGLTTGQVFDVTSTSAVLTSGELANFEHIAASATLSAKTGQLIDVTTSRENTAGAGTVADDYDAFSITRTSINTTAGGTLTATGSLLYLENVATQTAGTLTDSANLAQLIQDSDSSGDAINIDMNAALGAAALAVIDASGARTDAIIDITTTSTGSAADAAAIFQINTSGALNASANVIDVNVSGIALSNVVDITFATDAATGNAIDLNMGTNVAGMAISVGSAATGTSGEGSAFDVAHTGALISGADLVRIASTGLMATGGASHLLAVDHTIASAGGAAYDADLVKFERTYGDAASDAVTGSILNIVNGVTLDAAGTDATHLIELVQDSDSSGDALNIDMNAALGAAALTVIDASGARTDAIIDIITTSTGSAADAAAIFQITTSGALNASANVIDVNVSGIALSNVVDITFATDAATGNAIDLNMGTNLAGQAIDINLTGVRTDDGINIDDDSTGNTPVLDMNITGIRTGNAIDITYATLAATENALDLNMGTNVAGMAISVSSAATGTSDEGSALDVSHTGDLGAGADVIRILSTGSPSSTSNLLAVEQTTGAGTAGAFAVYINATGTNVEALKVDAGTVTFDETLTVSGLLTAAASVSVTGSVTASTFVNADAYQVTNGAEFSAANPTPTKADLQAASFWPVSVNANAVDIDLIAMDAADIGRKLTFAVTTGHGTQALTVTNGVGMTVVTINTVGTTAEDLGDYIECLIRTTATATCVVYAAD